MFYHALILSVLHFAVQEPNHLFQPMGKPVRVEKEEGESCILRCLLTDPRATDFSLRMENGTSIPPGMRYTADPRKGIEIHNLLPRYSADYVCRAWVNGVEKTSRIFSIEVFPKICSPPGVSLEMSEYVRIVGQSLEIVCSTHNPNTHYIVKWEHSSKNAIEKSTIEWDHKGTRITTVLTIPVVSMADTGNLTCVAHNEAGINRSTAFLHVVEEPYIRLSPRLHPKIIQNGTVVTLKEGEDMELGVMIEAYPPIQEWGWNMPGNHNASSIKKTFQAFNNRYEAALMLGRMTIGDQGQYRFYTWNAQVNSSTTFTVEIYQKPVTRVRLEGDATLTCISTGYPSPEAVWYQCSGLRTSCPKNDSELDPSITPKVEVERREHGLVKVRNMLTLTRASEKTTFECVASNVAGIGSDTFYMDVPFWSRMFVPILSGAVGLAGCLLLLLIIMFYKYKQKPRYEIRWKIIEASDGTTFIDPTQLPYNKSLEFPRDKLELGKVLGAGAFGKVVEATAYGLGIEENVQRVAVKMLKPSARPDEREALMSELKILSHLGKHKNIVNLLGACTHGGPMLVITEYCSHGDLQTFLRNKTETFLNFFLSLQVLEETRGYMNIYTKRTSVRSDSGVCSLHSDCTQNTRPALLSTGSFQGFSCEDDELDSWPLDMDDLLRFSYQVAQGLEFLASKNCIHRDVAARNVLLTGSRVAKICDFGLARDIMNDSSYVVKGNARLPVKWMAPESIFDCVYTVQSDVWSYGVLLWEIFSLGKNPYPGIPVDTVFYEKIRNGYQMAQPEFAPQEIYTIIKMCWNMEPAHRPTFQDVIRLIERLLYDQPLQPIYHNEQPPALEQPGRSSDCPVDCEEPQDRSCNHQHEDQPLMTANNYQFC